MERNIALSEKIGSSSSDYIKKISKFCKHKWVDRFCKRTLVKEDKVNQMQQEVGSRIKIIQKHAKKDCLV